MVRGPLLAVVLTCLVVGTACGEIPEPEGFTLARPASPSAPDADLSAANPAADGTTDTGPTTNGPAFMPQPPDDYIPEVLVATDTAVLVDAMAAAPDGTVPLEPFPGEPSTMGATRVVDDMLGGIVVEQLPVPPAAEGTVVWLKGPGAAPAVIEDGGARLLDVGYSNGSPFAVVQQASGEVDRIRLADQVTTSLFTPGTDETLMALSASGGLHAVVVSNLQCGDLRFYGPDGQELDLPGPGESDCIVPRRPAYGAVALSPDGGAVAYTVITYRNDGIEVATELVVRDLVSGIDYYRRKIGEDGDHIGALGFDGERVVYLRTASSGPTVTILELDGAKREVPLALPGGTTASSVSFARWRLAGR